MIKHGKSESRVYKSWDGMRSRCDRPSHNRYHRYGGRGISYDPRWSVFENFYADMGDPPSSGHSLDRINNDGNYEASNCRWATDEEQRSNRSDTHYIEIDGRKQSLTLWCKERGLPVHRVDARLRLLGWSEREALGFDVRPKVVLGPYSEIRRQRISARKRERDAARPFKQCSSPHCTELHKNTQSLCKRCYGKMKDQKRRAKKRR